MAQSFTNRLGDILFTDVISNSYYDDENTNECETPDYDAAYEHIIDTEKITKDDLKEVYYDSNENEEFTGLDLLKLAIRGDFATEFDYHSNMRLNLKALEALTLSLDKNPKIWNGVLKTKKEIGMGETEWKKHLANSTPLAQIAYDRVRRCSSTNNIEEIKTCKRIADRLNQYKSFCPEKGGRYHYNSLKTIYEECKDEKEKANFMKTARTLASYAKNKQYTKLARHPDTMSKAHYIKDCALEYLVFGKSTDTFFEEVAQSVKDLKQTLKERVKRQGQEDVIDLSC